MPIVKRISRSIPSLSSKEQTYEINDYSLGYDSFISNDKFPLKNGGSNMWRLAKNARITTLGEYETRKGFDYHSDAAGLTQDQTQTSVTGASNQVFNEVDRLAQTFTTSSAGRMTKLDVNIKNPSGATGTVIVELWTNVSGSPGVLTARSSIASSLVTTSYQYLTARFPDAPLLATTTAYWVVVYVQATGSGNYNWSGTTNATTAKSSSDSGMTWGATSFSLNFKQYYATDGGSKGMIRAYKSDGTKVTVFAHGTSLYTVNEVTGALTAIKTGLNASATHYRFALVNDILYYINGYDGYRKWDFTTESQVNATNYTHIALHKGLMFLADAIDPNKVVYSNFAAYETFTSTDFVYIPSPKTGDPVSAIQPLNGYLIFFTQNNKFILSGDDNATFSLDEAPDQKPTFTQETQAVDKNFVYYLSNDGMYRSNGSEAQLLSKSNYEEMLQLTNKEDCCVEVSKGRLYLWFKSSGSSINDSCYVWNLNYGSDNSSALESFDTKAYVGRAFNAFRDDNTIMVASSLVGQVFWQEAAANDYTNLGGDIDFELDTHYTTFTSPAVLKEIRYWQPRFGAQSGSYTISCEYATDLRDNWQVYSSPNVQGSGSIWGSGIVWGAFTWGSTAELQSQLYVPGEFRRIALRYKHYATRQPHKFLGHTLVVQQRRLR